jgi:ABC-type dipeptide/oligopeptide/nickel transport system permease component
MLHVVKLIERRYPHQAKSVVSALLIVSALGLIVGIYLAVA